MRKTITACVGIILISSLYIPSVEAATTVSLVSSQNTELLQSIQHKISILQAQVKDLESRQVTVTINAQATVGSSVTTESTSTITLPKIKVISLNKTLRINSEKGGLRARWTPKKSNVDIYLMNENGTSRLTELAKKVRGGTRTIKLDWEYLSEDSSSYRIQVCHASTSLCDVSDKPFIIFHDDTPTVRQDLLAPRITSISPTTTARMNGTLINVYGANFVAVGKGGDLRVRIKQGSRLVKEFKSTDSPMSVFAGVYASPIDTKGAFLQVKLDGTTFASGTYQLSVYLDGKESKPASLIIQ